MILFEGREATGMIQVRYSPDTSVIQDSDQSASVTAMDSNARTKSRAYPMILRSMYHITVPVCMMTKSHVTAGLEGQHWVQNKKNCFYNVERFRGRGRICAQVRFDYASHLGDASRSGAATVKATKVGSFWLRKDHRGGKMVTVLS